MTSAQGTCGLHALPRGWPAMSGSTALRQWRQAIRINFTSKTVGSAGNATLSASYTWNNSMFLRKRLHNFGLRLMDMMPCCSTTIRTRRSVPYDALGNLPRVDQKRPSSGDSIRNGAPGHSPTIPSRLLTAKNPESGTLTTLYDNDGELLQKTSLGPTRPARPRQTVSYCYDELHRVTGRGYGAQSCPLATPV